MSVELATLGGGCFWCLEAVFEQVKGVIKSVSGYTGGHDPAPNYKTVCNGRTGHAEVIQISFDPSEISFDQLLEVFFVVHDPTTKDRQGADVGTQYRSAIFYHSPEQEQIARHVINRLNDSKEFSAPIVTEVSPLVLFHTAEAYHQAYFRNHPEQPYCQLVVLPKVEKFFHKFGKLAGS